MKFSFDGWEDYFSNVRVPLLHPCCVGPKNNDRDVLGYSPTGKCFRLWSVHMPVYGSCESRRKCGRFCFSAGRYALSQTKNALGDTAMPTDELEGLKLYVD